MKTKIFLSVLIGTLLTATLVITQSSCAKKSTDLLAGKYIGQSTLNSVNCVDTVTVSAGSSSSTVVIHDTYFQVNMIATRDQDPTTGTIPSQNVTIYGTPYLMSGTLSVTNNIQLYFRATYQNTPYTDLSFSGIK